LKSYTTIQILSLNIGGFYKMLIDHIKHTANYIKSSMNSDANIYWNVAFTAVLVAVVFMIPADALAQIAPQQAVGDGSGDVAQVICNIVGELQGPVARGVAAFGIIFLGFSLFLGKISWGVALALGIGIGAIFGANQIVEMLSGDATGCNS
jgi:type IV secretion system protein VirB2